jgi:hypothetical protein
VRTIPERDWKYLRSTEKELLAKLCGKINRKALEILQAPEVGEHERYLRLYRHIEKSDKIVADCFNDWRRSDIVLKLLLIRKHKLLSAEMVAKLSEETRELLARWPE